MCGQRISATTDLIGSVASCPSCDASITVESPKTVAAASPPRLPTVRPDHYLLLVGAEQRGPYALSQLRTMWRSGSITADSLYWQESMTEWESIDGLGLDLAIQPVPPPLPPAALQRIPPSTHQVHHSGQVTTKSRGSGIVAIGSIMCIVGVIMTFTPARIFGGLLLFVGFFVAVVGRMMS